MICFLQQDKRKIITHVDFVLVSKENITNKKIKQNEVKSYFTSTYCTNNV